SLGGDAVGPVRQGAAGDRPVAASIGGAGADQGAAAAEQLHRAVGLRRAGEGRCGDVGDVVGAGAAAVAGGRQVRGRGGGRGAGVEGEADRGAGEGVARLVGGRRLDRVGAVALRRPGGQGGVARPGGRRVAGGGAVAGRQVEDRRLPARAR